MGAHAQVGVFRVAFLDTTEAHLAGQVDDRSEELVDAESLGLNGNDMTHLLDQVGVEGATVSDGGIEDGGIEGEEAVNGLTLDEGRDA